MAIHSPNQAQVSETLVLDTAPLLHFSTSLNRLANRFVTVQAVLDEVKDAKAKEMLASLADLTLDNGAQGLQVRSPSPQAMERVTRFAKHTGDIAALSLTDLAVLALTVTIEAEVKGWDSILSPSQTRMEDQVPAKKPRVSSTSVPAEAEPELEADGSPSEESGEDNDGEGEWITPSNIARYSGGSHAGMVSADSAPLQERPASACMTSDFAMQNVLLQMGLTVVAPSGQRIRNLKTWVLRCHGCFRLCKDPTKRFCPHCGGATLTRTSITYVTPSPKHPKGYIIHLKKNFQYRLRGTVYSVPNPLQANAKGAARDELILREDQREYQRGLKTATIAKSKQERAIARAAEDGDRVDPDWMPNFLVDHQSRKLPIGRLGKDGLPLIGYGRMNPNANRKGRKR